MATKKSTKTALEVGAVVAAAAGAAAGYYFYADKHAKKHRSAASKWAKGMKSQVVKEVKKLPKVDQKTVASIVDKAAAAYATTRAVNKDELAAATKELKKHWKNVQKEVGSLKAKVAKKVASKKAPAKKTAKKAAPKKAAKKTPGRAR